MARLRHGPTAARVLAALLVSAWLLAAAPAIASAAPTTLTLRLSPTSIRADGGTSSTTASVVVKDGTTGVGAETVTLTSTDSGQIPTSITMTDKGGGNYSATIPSSSTPGTATITATDSAASLSDSQPLIQFGPAAHIALQLSSSSITADGSSSTTATAKVTDAHDTPVPGDTVTILSGGTGDTVSGVSDNGDGTYTATITSTHSGASTITVTDQSVTGLFDQKTLTKTPGAAAHIALQLGSNPITANGTSTSAVTATVTDAHGNPRAGDTVTFTPAGRFGLVTDNGDGTYAATYTSTTTAGPVTITATDGGASGQATLTQNPGPVANVTVALSPNPIIADGTSQSTATATVTDANGNRIAGAPPVFTPTPVGAVIDHGDGTYTATYKSTTTAGSLPITATDGAFSGQATLQTVYASTTSLSATSQSPVTNQAVTLIAIVTASGGTQAPAGSITFEDNGVAIPGCASQPATAEQQLVSESTCQASFGASPSSHHLTAVFTSSATTIADSTGATTITVAQSATTTSLADPPSTLTTGSSVTYTATITASQPGALVPSGSVAFLDAGHTISACARQRVTTAFGAQLATCTVTYSLAGTHSITASYSGDGNFSASTSSGRTVTTQNPPVAIAGTIKSAMQWTFQYTRSYTVARAFLISGAPVGATVSVVCTGRGCPFKSHVLLVRTTKACTPTKTHKCRAPRPGVVNLLATLHRRHLRPGASLVVMITRLNWIGKYYRFTVRSGRPPAIQIDCLAPGGKDPGVGC